MQIQKFGLDIRTIGDKKAFFSDVNKILESFGIEKNFVSYDVQTQTVAHSLQKMFSSQSIFDICTIKDCARLCGIHISQERLSVYSSIHCMKWSEMLPEYRAKITAMVLQDFEEILNQNI